MKLGDKVFHLYGYGTGMALEVEGSIIRILWDDPELSQWEDELFRETFWTDLEDVVLLETLMERKSLGA